MISNARRLLWAFLLLAVLPAPRAHAAVEGVRLLSSDERGITLEVTTGDVRLTPPGPDGRVKVAGLRAAHTLGEPGRPELPAYSALIALPLSGSPSVRVLSVDGDVALEGVAHAIAGRPASVRDPAGFGHLPTVEPVAAIASGMWPEALASLGTPSAFRGRRIVSLEVRPFRYDEGAARLVYARSIRVRVDFGAAAEEGPAALADRHIDPALAASVLNWEQARGWRRSPRAFERPRDPVRARLPGEVAVRHDSEPEVRVLCDSTGLHVLAYDRLAPHGYPVGVPVAEVSVRRREYLSNPAPGQPPYALIELPIEVHDLDTDGVFGPGDLIWVYVQNWAERSGASIYQRQWGDGEVLYATREPGGGARMARRDGWRGLDGLTPEQAYPQRRRFERDFASYMPFVGGPNDTTFDLFQWTEITLYYSRPDTIRFDVHDIDTSRFVQFSTQWVGRRFGSFNLYAAVRNGRGELTTVADSVRWSNKAPFTASTSVRGSAFTDGSTNFLRQWGKNAFVAPHPVTNASAGVGLNWFEMTYWRRFLAVGDYLAFNSGESSGELQFRLSRFQTDSVRLYDVTDPLAPVRIIVDPAQISVTNVLTLDFQAQVAPGQRRQYVAAGIQVPWDPATGPRTPPASAYSAVVDRELWANASGDYLLVVPEAWLPQVQPLAAHRAAQGLAVVTAPIEAVYDEFNGGRRGPVGLQRFVRWAYQNWDARFLLMVGDGTLDPRNVRVTSGRDWIPVLPTPGPVPVSEGYEIVPADNRYACLTGNCDPIVGFGEVVPEMMVGRLPTNSGAETQAVVQKLIAYETLGGDQSWRRRVVLLSDDAYSGETFFGGGATSSNYCRRSYEERFVAIADTMRGVLVNEAGLALQDVDRFNLRYYLANEPFTYAPPADTCRPSRPDTQTRTHANVTPQLFSRLNQGVLWWNYQGHANEFVLGHEDVYRNIGDGGSDDKNLLTNTGRPFLYSAFSCHANMFARPENQNNPGQGASLGEDLVNLPGRGAIASWASVCFEVVPRDNANHLNVIMARALFSDPPRDEVLGERGSRVVLGEALLTTFLRFVPTVQSFAYERGVANTYALLGDPATRISVGPPQATLIANGAPVQDLQPVRLRTPGDTLRLEASLVSTVRLDSLGLYRVSGAGVEPVAAADYTVTPAFPDTAAGASVYGGRRFSLVHRTSLAPDDRRYVVVTRDRDGLESRLTASFELASVLRVDGVTINDGDDVSPTANLSLLLLSPAPVNPSTDLTLTINGQVQAFQAVANPGDASGREWILSWVHDPYPQDDYTVQLAIAAGPTEVRSFRVSTAAGELRLANVFPFPNPFDNEGTSFTFQLLGSEPCDARVTVMTVSGRALQSLVVRGLAPGYHQIRWDGRDAEGSEVANGVYFFRLVAVTPSGNRVEELGRLVKLRKPRRAPEEPITP